MAGDLLELLKPLLDEPQTRATALSALANSPTPADNAYFKSLIPVNGEIPIDILKAMENSGNQTTLKLWLGLLQNAAIPENYHFYARHNVLLCSEAFKSQVIEALKNIKNPKIAAQLMPALDKQTDVKRGSYPGRNKNQ